MNSTAHDRAFGDNPLRAARFHLTFAQNARATFHEIGAIHTGENGKVTPFRVWLVDPIRRQDFVAGVGAHIQTTFAQRCQEVFDRRAQAHAGQPVEGSLDTPDATEPAIEIVGLGAWNTATGEPVFLLAQWGWHDETGALHEDGFAPKRATP